MGIQGLTKLIKPTRVIKWGDLKGKTVAVDAMIQIHKALKTGAVCLFDHYGNPTHHLKTLLANIFKMYTYDIRQVWVFDYDASKDTDNEHKKLKSETLEIRSKRKGIIKNQLKQIADQIAELKDLQKEFGDESGELDEDLKNMVQNVSETELKDQYQRLKNQSRSVGSIEIKDFQKILDILDIEWLEAPKTYEAEHLASTLCSMGLVDYVWTPDTDAMLYGAKKIIKKSKGNYDTLDYYDMDLIMNDMKLSREDIIKIGICLGTDYNPGGILGIGVGRVFNKFRNIKYTDQHLVLIKKFLSNVPLSADMIHNRCDSFKDEQIKILIDWLVEDKKFNRERLEKQIDKYKLDRIKKLAK
jgi:5'-3' exonuclease